MEKLKIGIVGPCGAGKSTLISGLVQYGYRGKHIAQEHSYVPDMWKRITNPDILIYLDVSYHLTIVRKNLNWSKHEYQEQVTRLWHARNFADYYLKTDDLEPQDVLDNVLDFLDQIVQDPDIMKRL